MSNTVTCIEAYKIGPTWVFDDPSKGLFQEAFVLGADKVIETYAQGRTRVSILFSKTPFPGSDLLFLRTEFMWGGATYIETSTGMEAWLCSAIKKYFLWPPSRLHIAMTPIGEAVPVEEPWADNWRIEYLTAPEDAPFQQEWAGWAAEPDRDILDAIFDEMDRAEEKHGPLYMGNLTDRNMKYLVLAEEVGEVAKDILDCEDETEEMIQVAAMALAWLGVRR